MSYLISISIIFSFAFVGSACLAYFFEYAQGVGHILYPYRVFLEKLPKSIAKPLGLCVFCSHYWIYQFFVVALFIISGVGVHFSLFYIFAYIVYFFLFFGFSHVLLKVLKYYL